MAVFAIPNPKKSTIVDFPLEKIKQSVQNISSVNNKYKFTKANEIFNQYTYEALEFLSLGIFADINLNSISENKTEITVEIRRKIGSFNQAHEVTKANEHIDKIFAAIANLTSRSSEDIELLKDFKSPSKPDKKKDNRPFYKKKRFLIPIAFVFLIYVVGLFTDENKTSSNNTKTEQISNTAKLPIFNNIENTRIALSGNGIGNLSDWKSDQMGGFMSMTPYFQFGSGMPQNNLAYYLESKDESYIQTAKLILNINNKSEKKQALSRFNEITNTTFKSLLLEIPKGLNDAIEKSKEFESNSETFSTSLKLDKGKIDTWTLQIETNK